MLNTKKLFTKVLTELKTHATNISTLQTKVNAQKTLLWSGTWSSGTKSVPNGKNYYIYMVVLEGTPIICARNGNLVRGSVMVADQNSGVYTEYVRSFAANIDDDNTTWELKSAKGLTHTASSGYHTNGLTFDVTYIYGII